MNGQRFETIHEHISFIRSDKGVPTKNLQILMMVNQQRAGRNRTVHYFKKINNYYGMLKGLCVFFRTYLMLSLALRSLKELLVVKCSVSKRCTRAKNKLLRRVVWQLMTSTNELKEGCIAAEFCSL